MQVFNKKYLILISLQSKLNDSLGGFNFYTNPEVVNLIANNTPYKDADGNYVLSNSLTGQTLLSETETYTSATLSGDYRSVGGADSVTPFKKGVTIKSQTISTGRTGAASSRTFTFDQLSKVDGVSSSSCRIYYSSGDDRSCDGLSMSITGNKVKISTHNYSGGTYAEWKVTAFEIISD